MGAQRVQDENAKKQMTDKLNGVIPDKKLQDLLKGLTKAQNHTHHVHYHISTVTIIIVLLLLYLDPVNDGATHLSNIIKGRGKFSNGILVKKRRAR